MGVVLTVVAGVVVLAIGIAIGVVGLAAFAARQIASSW